MTEAARVELPNPFRFEDGSLAGTLDQWQRRREEMRDSIVTIEYGGLPPTPASTRWEELHTFDLDSLDGARYRSVRILTGPDSVFSFLLYLWIPAGSGPFPVVLNGDGCWRYVTDEVAANVVRRGNILARYHGILAPSARDREKIVPGAADEPEGTCASDRLPCAHRLPWGQLLARLFAIDVTTCPD